MSTHISINRQEEAIGKKHLSMKKSFLKFMTISLLTAMSMAMNAETIEYTDGDFKYSLETETKTAALSKYSGSATEVTIPESVTHDDVTYSVTRLGDKCFSYCSSLTSIDIPSSVTSLGDECFSYCSSLTSIDIPSSVTSLGYKCFYGCESLTSIDIPSSVTSLGYKCFSYCKSIKTMTCEIPTIPTVLGGGEFFSDTPIEQATLYVPESSLDSYKATSPWSRFGTILPISTTGIGEIATDGDACIDAIYNLEGKRGNGISRGLSIIRMSDGTTRKVLK